MLKGIDVILYVKTQTGVDGFNRPIYEETEETIHNVLVAPLNNGEMLDITNLNGKREEYTLAIPKGDTHDWENKKVKFFDKTFKTYGSVTQGIEALVPTKWHKKVMCGRYE